MTTDTTPLTRDEIAALARYGWQAGETYTANGIPIVRMRNGATSLTQEASAWRTTLATLDEDGDDHERRA